uniref:Protein kinase domain-containing protein n=1 Tax=Caenorhabditis tropicalis TaxID=1561998 RepID=A0A1I7UQW4_9PELO
MEKLEDSVAVVRARNESGCFSDSNALKISLCLVSGIQYLHEAGYHHRDLHEGNFLFSFVLLQMGVSVKITDFGLAVDLKNIPTKELLPVNTKCLFASSALNYGLEINKKDEYESILYALLIMAGGLGPISESENMKKTEEKLDHWF